MRHGTCRSSDSEYAPPLFSLTSLSPFTLFSWSCFWLSVTLSWNFLFVCLYSYRVIRVKVHKYKNGLICLFFCVCSSNRRLIWGLWTVGSLFPPYLVICLLTNKFIVLILKKAHTFEPYYEAVCWLGSVPEVAQEHLPSVGAQLVWPLWIKCKIIFSSMEMTM